MANAIFHSLRGEKSALIFIKANAFVFAGSPVYVPANAIPADAEEGDSLEIPDGYTLVPMVGEDGTVRRTKDTQDADGNTVPGSVLHMLAY
jgi:hypothetical protein